MANTMNGWEYLGDVNPFEHGGTWLRPEEGSETIFEFVNVQEATDEHVMISHGTVDLEESWIDKDLVSKFADVNYAKDMVTATAVLSYYGVNEFSSDPNFENSESKMKAYLKGQGIIL